MSVWALLSLVLLLILNGFFVAAEFAFTAASRHQLEARPGRAARAAVASIDELSFTLAGAQLGITIASLLLGAVAEPAVASLIEAGVGSFIEIPESVLHPVAFAVSLLIVVFLHMVIGEMAPKNIAIADPERSSIIMAIPFRAYSTVFRPVIWVLNGLANLGLRSFGIDPDDVGEAHTADDLASMITAGRREGVVEEFAHRLLTGAIDLGDLEATDVMVPRPDVVAVSAGASATDLEETFTTHGYSRVPLYGEDLDDLLGFAHMKDLLALSPEQMQQSLPERLVRPLLFVPESVRIDRLLEEMRRERNHLAAVIDEHGGTAGIVTMEDIVEEVVGEIRDEHDTEAEGIRRISPTRWLVDASLRPGEVRRHCDVELPDGEYDTLSGLVMEKVGRIPAVGDRVDGKDWTLRVRTMQGRRVGKVDLMARRGRSQ